MCSALWLAAAVSLLKTSAVPSPLCCSAAGGVLLCCSVLFYACAFCCLAVCVLGLGLLACLSRSCLGIKAKTTKRGRAQIASRNPPFAEFQQPKSNSAAPLKTTKVGGSKTKKSLFKVLKRRTVFLFACFAEQNRRKCEESRILVRILAVLSNFPFPTEKQFAAPRSRPKIQLQPNGVETGGFPL